MALGRQSEFRQPPRAAQAGTKSPADRPGPHSRSSQGAAASNGTRGRSDKPLNCHQRAQTWAAVAAGRGGLEGEKQPRDAWDQPRVILKEERHPEKPRLMCPGLPDHSRQPLPDTPVLMPSSDCLVSTAVKTHGFEVLPCRSARPRTSCPLQQAQADHHHGCTGHHRLDGTTFVP